MKLKPKPTKPGLTFAQEVQLMHQVWSAGKPATNKDLTTDRTE